MKAPIRCMYCGGDVEFGKDQMVAVDIVYDPPPVGIRWAHTACYDRRPGTNVVMAYAVSESQGTSQAPDG